MNRSSNRLLHTSLQLMYEMVFLAFGFLIIKDWFLSEANPYPYTSAFYILCGVCASYVLYFYFSKFYLVLARRYFHESDSVHISVPKSKIVRGGLTLLLLTPALWSASTFEGKITPFPPIQNTDASWLGSGLGTAGANSWSTMFISEQGWGAALALILLVFLAVLIGAIYAFETLRYWDRRETHYRAFSMTCALVAMGAVFLDAETERPFLHGAHGLSTWGILIAFAWIGGIHAVPRQKGFEDLGKVTRPTVSKTSRSRIILVVILVAAAACLVEQLASQNAVKRYAGNGTPSCFHQYTSSSAVATAMRDATVAMEDHAFYQHHGFDWIAMHHALRVDLREGQIKEGGSTITQQLAKNLFLTNDRTVWRKIEEAAYTWELERMLSKRRILELYLNSIDYGMGQRGITAAAGYYFHKSPAQLTLAESAILVGIVPDPMHQQIDQQRLLEGRQTALSRIRYFFPDRYTQEECDRASWYPLNLLIYPDKDAWDRGATCEIPSEWAGVKFFFFANPEEAMPIDQASLSLKTRLFGFLDDAHRNLHVVGIEHLGVYNDRSTRQSEKTISSHAYGQAIDISGFRFADGSRVSVKDHTNSRVMAKLAPLEAMLKRHFDVVVDWNDDPKRHQTHFHTEVKGPRPSAPRSVEDPPAKSMEETMTEIRQASHLPARIRTWLQRPLIQQTTGHSCGEACVAAILSDYRHKPSTEAQIMHFLQTEEANGTESEELIRAFKAHGETAVSRHVSVDELIEEVDRTGAPVIASFVRPAGHWIFVVGEWEDYLLIADPQRGNILMPKNEFYARSDGDIIALQTTNEAGGSHL